MNEWMTECLTTPQHEKQIGYWVSELFYLSILQQNSFFFFFNSYNLIMTLNILFI